MLPEKLGHLIFFCVYHRHTAGVGLWSEWPCAVHHAPALCWGTHRLQRQRRTHGSAPGHHQRQCESHQRESPMLRSLPNLKSVLLLQLQILLSYRASPNYRDAKGLTPLYHTAIMGDDTGACEALLRHHAEMGVKDQGGWTELHQVKNHILKELPLQ